jgi:signal transduction histidine kinase
MWISKQSRRLALSHAQLESVILERTAELQILTQRLLKVQDEERRKLARDLHDSTGQTLAALKISVSFLQDICNKDSTTMERLAEVIGLTDQAAEEIRTMSYLLHPPLLDEVGFPCAAEWYVEGFAKRSGIKIKLDLATDRVRLPIPMEIALFRVLQESLTNVHRHSKAKQAAVYFHRHSEMAILEIRDSGCGIPAERLLRLRETSADTGVGLAGMRERMNELDGKLEITSDKRGTCIRATIPLPAIARPAQPVQSGNRVQPASAAAD